MTPSHPAAGDTGRTRPSPSLRHVAFGLLAIVVLAIMSLSLFACYQWGRASARSDSFATVNDLNGCRAQYRIDLVDQPTLTGLAAAILADRDGLVAAVRAANVARYGELVEQSRKDPGAFLMACRRDYP